MKRCDLHIHTVKSLSDREFMYDRSVLIDYVEKNKLEVIAITNHNLFDYNQFLDIQDALHDTIVLPGIEVDLEKGHILVIANNDADSVFDFNAKCKDVSDRIHTESDDIKYDTFVRIFGDLSKYLLIPHYDKKPSLKKEVLEKFGRNIIAGEVCSVKKFIYMKNDADEILSPVYFSDFRAEHGIKEEDYPVSHTYLDLNEVNVKGLRLCLMDKSNVSLTADKGAKLFQIFPDGQMLSTGLNIMFGKRSSGKTHTLDAIANRYGDRAKYIRQFELLDTRRQDSDQFENDLKVRQEKYAENYLKEFGDVVSDILEIPSAAEDEASVHNYLDSVMAYAQLTDTNDVFSKATLFNEGKLKEESLDEIERLIKATLVLLDTQQFKTIVNKYITDDLLKSLLKELIETIRERKRNNRYIAEVNNIIRIVKEALQIKSAAPRIPEVDFYKYFVNRKKREVFTKLAFAIKENRAISSEKAGQFTICVSSRRFSNANDLKSVVHRQMSLARAYSYYDDPLRYIEELVQVGVDRGRIFKMFAAIDYKILNSSGLPVSGGERSEFNFLQKIKDSILCDILLIDEPESSFDNLFLKAEVNKFIKEMAKKMPVVISTHNNTIGGSIKPDYILYTEKKLESGEPHFFIYSGFPESKKLMDVNGNTIENYQITLNSLEAGEQAYTERRYIYETLKN